LLQVGVVFALGGFQGAFAVGGRFGYATHFQVEFAEVGPGMHLQLRIRRQQALTLGKVHERSGGIALLAEALAHVQQQFGQVPIGLGIAG
jgi:hypothetical protein